MGFAVAPHKNIQRAYSAGTINRLTGNWGTSIGSFSRSVDAETRYTLRVMRGRSRELYQNNDYFKKFVRLCVKNIAGPYGMAFKNLAKDQSGALDTQANALIKERFGVWGKKGTCDVTGKLSWADCQRLFIQAVVTDGEVLVRKIRNYKNGFKFALQFLEADHLDENYNSVLSNGNEIRMGVEFDQWDRAIAYHLLVQHPGDYTYQRGGSRYERILATDMIHAFVTERPRQTRGIPWGHTAMTRLNNLGVYEEAAIISKRTSASKMGFIVPPLNEFTNYEADEMTPDGDMVSEVEPGMLEELPPGYDFKQFSPSEPGGDYDPFMSRTLKGIASGLDVSAHKLSSDLSGVNYSSGRLGELDDRDTWRIFQSWMSETLNDDVAISWLDVQLLGGLLITPNGSALPYAKFDKFAVPSWRPRGWLWVDPLKDQQAGERGIAMKTNTRTRMAAEQGEDLEEIFAEIQAEQALAERYGVKLIDPMPNGTSVKLQDEPVEVVA